MRRAIRERSAAASRARGHDWRGRPVGTPNICSPRRSPRPGTDVAGLARSLTAAGAVEHGRKHRATAAAGADAVIDQRARLNWTSCIACKGKCHASVNGLSGVFSDFSCTCYAVFWRDHVLRLAQSKCTLHMWVTERAVVGTGRTITGLPGQRRAHGVNRHLRRP